MKELLLIGTMAFALVSGGATAVASTDNIERPERGNHISVATLQKLATKKQDAIDAIKMEKLRNNGILVEKAINKLSSHVGKTWYVFSGNTPSGWDCSGLTMWFYEQLDIELEHRATIQATGGKKVSTPKPGDIVAFHYENSRKAYHVGIYIGNGKMIHSPAPGKRTSIEDIEKFGGSYSDISYVRYIETI